MKTIKIANKKIGNGSPALIVAELSCNHLQKFETAVKTIHAIKQAGADAVKLQTYTPDTITINCNNKYFRIKKGTLWDGKTLYQLYSEAYTPWDWHPKLKAIAEKLGLLFFSSPFDRTAVDFLDNLDVPAYKIASFEITDTPLIEYIASKGKPVIISTGIAELRDISKAISACKKSGNNNIILMKCTSEYPAPLESLNLRTIPDMIERFDMPVGLSDHTTGIATPVASIILGTSVIEKHFILDRKLGGPDAQFSVEPDEFRSMVDSIREAEKSMGKISYKLTDSLRRSREFSRSLFVVKDMKPGDTFTNNNVRSIRPGFGLHPGELGNILGRKSKKQITAGTPLERGMVAGKHLSVKTT